MVSIIIPAYNAETTIEKCIKSAISQTYTEVEIILIDDGSTDKTVQVCKFSFKEEKNVNIYSICHGGVSRARNHGIAKAKGEFIYFLDADDYIEPNTIEKLVIEQGKSYSCELVVCSYAIEGLNQKKYHILNYSGNYKREQYNTLFRRWPSDFYFGAVWNKIFLRNIIVNNDIKFDERMDFGEDFKFVLEYLRHVTDIVLIPDELCHYVKHSESLSEIEYSYEKNVDRRIELFKLYKEYFIDINEYEENEKEINQYIIRHAILLLKEWLDEKDLYSNKSDLQLIHKMLAANGLDNRKTTIGIWVRALKCKYFPWMDITKIKDKLFQ